MQSGKEDPPKGLAGCIIYGGHSHFPMYTEANIAKFVFELVKGKYLYAPCTAERNKRRKRGLSSLRSIRETCKGNWILLHMQSFLSYCGRWARRLMVLRDTLEKDATFSNLRPLIPFFFYPGRWFLYWFGKRAITTRIHPSRCWDNSRALDFFLPAVSKSAILFVIPKCIP